MLQCLLECGREASRGEREVEKPLDHVVGHNPIRLVLERLAERFGDHMGRPTCHPGQREHHQGSVAFKLDFGGLNLNLSFARTLAKDGFEGVEHQGLKVAVDGGHAWVGWGR